MGHKTKPSLAQIRVLQFAHKNETVRGGWNVDKDQKRVMIDASPIIAARNRGWLRGAYAPGEFRITPEGLKAIGIYTCFKCNKECKEEMYCYGCRATICEACDKSCGMFGGGHVKEDHLRFQED